MSNFLWCPARRCREQQAEVENEELLFEDEGDEVEAGLLSPGTGRRGFDSGRDGGSRGSPGGVGGVGGVVGGEDIDISEVTRPFRLKIVGVDHLQEPTWHAPGAKAGAGARGRRTASGGLGAEPPYHTPSRSPLAASPAPVRSASSRSAPMEGTIQNPGGGKETVPPRDSHPYKAGLN